MHSHINHDSDIHHSIIASRPTLLAESHIVNCASVMSHLDSKVFPCEDNTVILGNCKLSGLDNDFTRKAILASISLFKE